MATNSVQAWLIHKQWSGDTSARVSFFTRELGLLSCLCKGGRTPKKQALLQAFLPLWLGLDERYDRYYTRSIESTSPMLLLQGNSLISAWYLNELLYYALTPGSPDEPLFNAYSVTLHSLALTSERLVVESILRRFEWSLIKTCGYSFSLTQEARTGDPILAHAYYQFAAGHGFLLATKGIPGEHLLAIAADNLNEASYLKSAKIIMRKAIDHLLGGRVLRSRALYAS